MSVDLSKTRCVNCARAMSVTRLACTDCGLMLEGSFEVSPLGRLEPQDQAFVMAFVRYHGSIKKMEEAFGVSYPTVKNRLNAIAGQLDQGYLAPSTNGVVLEQLAKGEITVNEALERLD